MAVAPFAVLSPQMPCASVWCDDFDMVWMHQRREQPQQQQQQTPNTTNIHTYTREHPYLELEQRRHQDQEQEQGRPRHGAEGDHDDGQPHRGRLEARADQHEGAKKEKGQRRGRAGGEAWRMGWWCVV